MLDKLKNKENLKKLWKRTKDVAKVIGDEAVDSYKNIQEKVKAKAENWEKLEDVQKNDDSTKKAEQAPTEDKSENKETEEKTTDN